MNWKLYVDGPERRALDLCHGSMDEGDGWGSGWAYGGGRGNGNGDGGSYCFGQSGRGIPQHHDGTSAEEWT